MADSLSHLDNLLFKITNVHGHLLAMTEHVM